MSTKYEAPHCSTSISNIFLYAVLNKLNLICDISGSHGGKYEENSLLGCSAMWSR
jgi:hypothetical protein